MTTFLHDVAEFVLNGYSSDLKDSCIVFPNRRSAVYFSEELKKIQHGVIWLPKYYTIDEFIHNIVNQRVATQIAQLSTLYQVKCELSDSDDSFDRFFQWGQVILADFEDIDKYLVDAHALLKNVQDIKELENNIDYLTKEQRDAVEHFFNIALDSEGSILKKKFLDIWHILLPMYERFNQRLASQQLTYDGAVYRRAAQMVRDAEYDLPYSKVFFVGFNAITNAEKVIFKVLKQQDKAVFFWDYDESYLRNHLHEAGKFLRNHVKDFPEPEAFAGHHNFDFKSKSINMVESPTVSGQLITAANCLRKIPSDEISDTALVLSDETLLTSALEHVVPYMPELNVTMGYKIKNSIAGQWIEQLLQLQANKRMHQGEMKFYFRNVLGVIQHPFFMAVEENFANDIVDKIKKDAIFQVPIGLFAENEFAKLVFQPIDNQNDFSKYLLDVLKALMRWFATREGDAWLIQQELVYRLILQVQQLDSELDSEGLQMELQTYFQLLRKYVNSAKVPFEGEPVSGLQVMGFLETRNIDLKHLIILSVNEDKLPVSGNAPTFIPYTLRRGFGLPTSDDREAMYAYYFYRLLQRAEDITLTYFSGKRDGQKSECSRYIMQLLYGDYNVKTESLQSNISYASNELTEINKGGLVKDKLSKYYIADDSGHTVTMSPSSIVDYQICPVRFYFKKLMRLSVDEDIDENIDNRVFGNIFHKAAQDMYSKFVGRGKISAQDIMALKNESKKYVDNAFVQEIFRFYKEQEINKMRSGEISVRENLKNDQRIVYDVICKYVEALIEHDAGVASEESGLEFVSLEKCYSALVNVKVDGKMRKIKVGGTIDRVDKCGGAVRIVDYKTGSNDIAVNSFESIFDPELIKDNKGALQTLIYCMAYDYEHPDNDVIEPFLYKTTQFKTGEDLRIHAKEDKKEPDKLFTDGNYISVKEQVRSGVEGILSELFDYETPFVPTSNSDNCKYCDFSFFCNKRLQLNNK